MNEVGCTCETGGLANTKVGKCPPRFKNTVSLFFVPLVNTAGGLNGVDLTSIPATGLNLELLTLNPDPSVRWYPVHELKNVKLPKEDTKFEEGSGGEKARLRGGIQRFEAEVWENGFAWACQMEHNLCSKMGVVLVDGEGNLMGIKKGDFLRPIPIGAFDPNYMFLTDDNTDKTMLKFDFARSVGVCDYWMVTPSFIDPATSPFDQLGIQDANFFEAAKTATTVTFKIYDNYQSNNVQDLSKRGIQGVTAGMLTIQNTTTNTAVAVASVVANAAGTTYLATFAAQTTGDTLGFKLGAYTIGYEGSTTVIAV